MKYKKLTFTSLLAIGLIYLCVGVAWFLLGGAISFRTSDRSGPLAREVVQSWGPELRQMHPEAWYQAPSGQEGGQAVRIESSDIDVKFQFEPVRKGLLWYRSYAMQFQANYRIPNPTPIAQTVYVSFRLPSADASYNGFRFDLEGSESDDVIPKQGLITQVVVIPAESSVPLVVAYETRGLNRWDYSLGNAPRVRDFKLSMTTDFAKIDFPVGTASPTSRQRQGKGWALAWDYPDVIGAQPIAMDMPKVLNAGPVASRISFFAPVSLLFFFAVLLILGSVSGINLHPMNYFFLAAGCFAFQLLFAYTVDIFPLHFCFLLSAAVSIALVCGYLHAVAGKRLTRIALPAQLIYMILFSYSFFFDGLSGLTITVGAIGTLAVLMIATAKVDWSEVFVFRRARKVGFPPPMPEV
ncbi:inner membrane CreD family protein [Coraliomargarita parva]|uniref:inner membrane CreD family protein n=1 Tax=Coraliomargarita parva TaxID=3014050 RepID=UPI0022B547A2|nr:inner membrane CreD family protein [Coraliomargarita parva]